MAHKIPGEPGLLGWTIYIDENDNDVFDFGEPSDVTNLAGNYILEDLEAGTFVVREVLQPFWTQTQPGGAAMEYSVDVDINGAPPNVFGVEFGNNLTGLFGIKFNDLNGNGVFNSNEFGVARFRYLSGPGRQRRFDDRRYRVDNRCQRRLRISQPCAGHIHRARGTTRRLGADVSDRCRWHGYTVDLVQNGKFTALNFGNIQLAAIIGVKYHDLNQNGAAGMRASPVYKAGKSS